MTKRLRVLSVEDSPNDAELILRELRRHGYDQTHERVETAAGLQAALDRGTWDVIIADYSLPQFSGTDALAIVRQRGLDIPFIVVSGTIGEETAVAVMKAGAHDFINKNNLARLGAAVARELGEAEGRRERHRVQEALRESNRRLEETLQELKQAEGQIVQQERLRALGQMASGIAHDFNNSLSSILGFSNLLLSKPAALTNPTLVREYLEYVRTAATDAANTVRRLRGFYRRREDEEELVPVDVSGIVQQAVSLTQPKWKDQAQARGCTIRVETQLGTVPLVAGTESELREGLINLILNAVDAMTQEGVLTLRTECPGSEVLIEVRDTGIGMTEEVKRRCFEPFFTTKGENGTGLGLAMVYGMVHRHNGTIEVESAPAQGTTFRIRLPALHETTSVKRERSATATRRLRVLVVDDEAANRKLLSELLAGDGHVVETAENGRVALSKFCEGWYDLVITDRAMPEMGGEQFAAIVKQQAPKKPVILLSGFDRTDEAPSVSSHVVDRVIRKPIMPEELREAIAQVVGKGEA